MKKAFTLIELLVVIAIIAILAAILFPVFTQAKEQAKKTQDISNMKQWGLAVQMYLGDNDDTAPIWMYNYSLQAAQGDAMLLNLINGYVKSVDMTKTPNSSYGISQRTIHPDFPNPNTVAAQYKEAQKLINLGYTTDYGLNYQVYNGFYNPAGAAQFATAAVNMGGVEKPAESLYLITGVYDRVGGQPTLGGQLPIDPPCRQFNAANGSTDTLAPVPSNAESRWYFGGWKPTTPLAWNVFGGAWPYYTGKATIGFADSHVKPMSMTQVAAGCDVRDSWAGQVFDPERYIWDRL